MSEVNIHQLIDTSRLFVVSFETQPPHTACAATTEGVSGHMATKKKFTKVVGWGEALYLEVHLRSPGLKQLTDAIRLAVGDHIGTRNTFAKLFEMSEPPTELDPKDRFRAWLVLTALGQDPEAWGIGEDTVPPSTDTNRLRDLISLWSGWLSETAGLVA